MIDDRKGEGRFWATLALAAILVLGLTLRDPLPSPAGENAPADAFSATRARAFLTRILGAETPHPTGSGENGIVRQRIIDELGKLGVEAMVDESLVCAESGTCGVVTNIVFDLPGRIGGPAVLVNAHYDSVAASPGAGDDGAGVAAILEVTRALKASPTLDRTVRFLIDDGEEVGLLGAESWIRSHSADETLAVLVLEARGSSGPALLFETNDGNLELVRAYAGSVPNPATSSLFFSLYERLPNRTNFTVFKREGYTGMAVAFIEDPAHYHTPLNDLEHLSDNSVQHMGDLTLAMARELASSGLEDAAGNASYFDLLGATVVFWPESWNIWLSVSALFLVAVTGVVAMRQERASAVQILMGWLVVLLSIVLSGGIGWCLLRLSRIRGGDAGWIANGDVLILVAWLVAAAVVTAPYTLVRRTPSLLSIWTSVWLIHGIVGVLLSRLLPGAAYLFFIPAMAAGLSGLVSIAGRRRERNEGMIVVPSVVSLVLAVPILSGLYDGLGLVALPGISALAALLLLPLLVVSTEARRPAVVTLVCTIAAIGCTGWFALTPVFSSDVPRSLNVVAIHDETGASSMTLLGSVDPLPPVIANAASWSKQPVELFRRAGAARAPSFWTAPLDGVELARPDLSSSTLVPGEDATSIMRLVIKPVDRNSVIRLHLPEGAYPSGISCGSHTVSLPPGQGERISLRGIPDEGCVVRAAVSREGEVRVIEERPGLPDAAGAIARLRTNAEVPIGPGDRSMIVTRLPLADLPEEVTDDAGSANAEP